jgi:hypothetical protein
LRDAITELRNKAFFACKSDPRATERLRVRLGRINERAGLPSKGGIDRATREQLQSILVALKGGNEGASA